MTQHIQQITCYQGLWLVYDWFIAQ